MKPYYEANGITIYLGDCRELLRDLPMSNLLCTDPPYGINRDGKKVSTSSHGGTKAYEFLGWDNAPPDRVTFEQMFACSVHQIIWGANYFTNFLPPSRGWLIWDKGQKLDQADAEIAFTSFDNPIRSKVINRVEIQRDGAVHPTQKPLSLMTWCLSFLPLGSVIDPYMGSGTTLVAAKDLGRKAIGIEICEEYAEIAANRLSQEVLALT
jgi:DNA modification methylase